MAIIIKTTTLSDLLKVIRKEIDEGKIETWSYDVETLMEKLFLAFLFLVK